MIAHLLSVPYGGLFVGAGLGKTACVLEAFSCLRALGLAERMLVVAPLRVANLTWGNEVDKWKDYRDLRVINLRTENGKKDYVKGSYDIAVCNFEMLPKLCLKTNDGLLTKELPNSFPDILCIDELSKCKSHTSKRIGALAKVSHKFRYRWGLTGTPTPNSVMDLFAQVRIIDGGATFGRAITPFRERYFIHDPFKHKYYATDGAQKLIEEKVSERFLSLPREQYLEIPNVNEEDIVFKLQNHSEYKALEKEYILQLPDGYMKEMTSALTLITKLRQMAIGLVYDDNGGSHSTWCKGRLAALLKAIKSSDSPCLVAVHYRNEMEYLHENIKGSKLFVGGDQKKQQEILSEWNTGKIPVLIANPQSVSHGLNMQQGGSTIIWHSLSYSAEQYEQMNARLARTGQENPTRIIRILAEDTIDDTIAECLREKISGQKALIRAIHLLKEQYK